MKASTANPLPDAVTKSLAILASMFALAIPLAAFGQAATPCVSPTPPPGAAALGYTQMVFCDAPKVSEIDFSADGSAAKLYAWTWYNKAPSSPSIYSDVGGELMMDLHGGLNTETHQSKPGILPLLRAGDGFYVEFSERISDNNSDHWPAVWMMPQEHDGHHHDYVAGDAPGSERWLELDVDEGGFNPGHHGAAISWFGTWPNYQKVDHGNDPHSTFGLDRTQEHVFGLSYDPNGRRVTWWLDGVSVGSVSTADVPAIVNTHHYYLIMGAQSHKLNLPYQMYVKYFSAWSSVAQSPTPNSPSGVKVQPIP
jgi:hypothetical protein